MSNIETGCARPAIEFRALQFEDGLPADLMIDAIFIPGGNRILVTPEGRYKTSPYSIETNGMAGGMKARVSAGARLANVYSNCAVIALSRPPSYIRPVSIDNKDILSENQNPTYAEVTADELIRKGIDGDRICIYDSPNSTITELMEILRISTTNNFLNPFIVINEYNHARSTYMLDQLLDSYASKKIYSHIMDELRSSRVAHFFVSEWDTFQEARDRFKTGGGQIRFAVAEKILSQVENSRYPLLINKVKGLKTWEKRVESERNGIKDMSSGNYKLGSLEEFLISTYSIPHDLTIRPDNYDEMSY